MYIFKFFYSLMHFTENALDDPSKPTSKRVYHLVFTLALIIGISRGYKTAKEDVEFFIVPRDNSHSSTEKPVRRSGEDETTPSKGSSIISHYERLKILESEL